jgi:hypothetical protein
MMAVPSSKTWAVTSHQSVQHQVAWGKGGGRAYRGWGAVGQTLMFYHSVRQCWKRAHAEAGRRHGREGEWGERAQRSRQVARRNDAGGSFLIATSEQNLSGYHHAEKRASEGGQDGSRGTRRDDAGWSCCCRPPPSLHPAARRSDRRGPRAAGAQTAAAAPLHVSATSSSGGRSPRFSLPSLPCVPGFRFPGGCEWPT